jgi:hypothetical protein
MLEHDPQVRVDEIGVPYEGPHAEVTSRQAGAGQGGCIGGIDFQDVRTFVTDD